MILSSENASLFCNKNVIKHKYLTRSFINE